ncbi:hypothetical protein IJ095_03180 [Candidatus Saccharibacteria bacterium]|nr:hypothetical protein [Candidatus Saccharibacteria bacterium]
MFDTRERGVEILGFIYEAWLSSWQETRVALGELNLSSSLSHRLNFYENEQHRSIVSCLATLLTAWETANDTTFSATIPKLARELRPSLAYLEPEEEGLALTPAQLALLRTHISRTAQILKSSIADLRALSPVVDPLAPPLTVEFAESLLRDKLGLSAFDFLDFKEEPEFHSGYFPALLQESVDFGF